MKVRVNKRDYKVEIKEQDGIEGLGLTNYKKGTIEILKGIDKELTKSTIIHELTHAYLFEYGMPKEEYTLEDVCNFIGAYGEEIINKSKQVLDKIIK